MCVFLCRWFVSRCQLGGVDVGVQGVLQASNYGQCGDASRKVATAVVSAAATKVRVVGPQQRQLRNCCAAMVSSMEFLV